MIAPSSLLVSFHHIAVRTSKNWPSESPQNSSATFSNNPTIGSLSSIRQNALANGFPNVLMLSGFLAISLKQFYNLQISFTGVDIAISGSRRIRGLQLFVTWAYSKKTMP